MLVAFALATTVGMILIVTNVKIGPKRVQITIHDPHISCFPNVMGDRETQPLFIFGARQPGVIKLLFKLG